MYFPLGSSEKTLRLRRKFYDSHSPITFVFHYLSCARDRTISNSCQDMPVSWAKLPGKAFGVFPAKGNSLKTLINNHTGSNRLPKIKMQSTLPRSIRGRKFRRNIRLEQRRGCRWRTGSRPYPSGKHFIYLIKEPTRTGTSEPGTGTGSTHTEPR